MDSYKEDERYKKLSSDSKWIIDRDMLYAQDEHIMSSGIKLTPKINNKNIEVINYECEECDDTGYLDNGEYCSCDAGEFYEERDEFNLQLFHGERDVGQYDEQDNYPECNLCYDTGDIYQMHYNELCFAFKKNGYCDCPSSWYIGECDCKAGIELELKREYKENLESMFGMQFGYIHVIHNDWNKENIIYFKDIPYNGCDFDELKKDFIIPYYAERWWYDRTLTMSFYI